MLLTSQFNEDDIVKLKQNRSSLSIYLLGFLISTPFAFLIGLTGLLENASGYWPVTLISLSAFFGITLLLFVKDLILYKLDMSKQIKYSGSVTVEAKSIKDGELYIWTNAKEIRKVELDSKELFDKVAVGNQLKVEISKYSKVILQLKRNGLDLLAR